MALFFEWAENGADSYHPLGVQPKLHRQHRSLSHARGDASIRTGLIHLVFHLVTVERSGASFACKSVPYSSVRAFHRHRLPPAGGRAANKCGGKRCSAGCKLLEQPELQALACQYQCQVRARSGPISAQNQPSDVVLKNFLACGAQI